MKSIDSVKKAIDRYDMLKNTDEVCVALSGGADSVALLHIMLSLADNYGVRVIAFHLNHRLRGDESNRDEAFVKSLCERLTVPLVTESADIAEIAKSSKQSVELAARNVRYKYFAGYKTVATAHTASDNLETVLLNLARGTSLSGICGIPPVRDNLIRPLIYLTREQTENYCRENNLPFVTDSTNLSDDYTRNNLRHNAVPVLKSVNSKVEQSVSNMSDVLRQENSFLENTAYGIYKKMLKGDKLSVANINGIDNVLLRRIIRIFVFEKLDISLDSTHTENVLNIVCAGKGSCSLPQDNIAAVIKKELTLKKAYNNDIDFSVETQTITKEEYDNRLKVNKMLAKSAVDSDKIVGELLIRTRADKDSIKLVKRGTKTLKKLYNELAIPNEMRANLPVAADDNGVLFVHFAGVSARVAVDNNTKNVTVFSVTQL